MRIGLLGCGTVGTGVAEMLQANADVIAAKTGTRIELVKALIRDKSKAHPVPTVTDPNEILCDPTIETVVEVMGGLEPAGTYIARALDNGKHVVTANKELMAKRGHDLLKLAESKELDLLFEASVCGGIPIIQALKNQLSGNRIRRVMGIVNGTTNYILTRMHSDRASYADALAEAKDKGYAEADPSADVENNDAQSKLAILSSIAFTSRVTPENVYREGISHVAPRDVEHAEMLGYRIKSLAIGQETDGKIEARVHPALVPLSNPLAKVDGAHNAVLIQGDFVGDVMLFGPGAGKEATASAIVGDLVDIARNRRLKAHGRIGCTCYLDKPVQEMSETQTRYYLRLTSQDRPKALGQIATAFGDHDISLSGLEMHELPETRSELVFTTHKVREGNFLAAVEAIKKLPMIESVDNWLRVEI